MCLKVKFSVSKSEKLNVFKVKKDLNGTLCIAYFILSLLSRWLKIIQDFLDLRKILKHFCTKNPEMGIIQNDKKNIINNDSGWNFYL